MQDIRRLLVTALIAMVPAASAAVDLTGKWRFELVGENVPDIIEVTQSGSSLSFTYGPYPLSGSVTDGDPFATWQAGYSEIGDGALVIFNGRIMPSGNLIDAYIVYVIPLVGSGSTGIIATRCTCDDDNTTDGDGCSAECQVEPCWTCSGDPSVCSPSSDGSTCEDGSVCTTGETCSAGVCAGGTLSSPCIDMTGRWHSAGSIAGSGDYEMSTDITQRETDLVLRVAINGVARMAGTVDPVTGAFDVRLARTDTCEAGFDTLIGSATSLTYTAAGSVRRPRPSQPSVCDTHAWSETGMRCGSGTVDAGEACDDGNLNDGDGCSATCGVEACWRCTGTPSACVRAPRAPCKGSTAPAKSTLSIRNVSDHYRDKLVWRWKKGEDTNLAELGDPVGTDDYVLCMFDESSPTPALLFSAVMPAAPLCDGSSCWAATGSSGLAYRNKSAVPEGVIKTRIRSGTGGAAKAQVKGKGIHMSDRAFPLPPLPLALPLRVQLQGAGGFCAETRHDAGGVLSNDPGSGLFRARGVP